MHLLYFWQALMVEAMHLAQQYPADQRVLYMETAQTLRLPFWDWCVCRCFLL